VHSGARLCRWVISAACCTVNENRMPIPMRLIHFSREPKSLDSLRDASSQRHRTDAGAKPDGLWFRVGDGEDWIALSKWRGETRVPHGNARSLEPKDRRDREALAAAVTAFFSDALVTP
jgi:hypothetical protein